MRAQRDANFPSRERSWQPLFAHMVDGLVNQPLLSLGPKITEQPDNCSALAFVWLRKQGKQSLVVAGWKGNIKLLDFYFCRSAAGLIKQL